MPRKISSIHFQLITYCMLIGSSFAIIGKNVRNVQPGLCRFVASISRRANSSSDTFENHHRCTGSVIEKRSVLTAAHCLLNVTPKEIEIIVGSVKLTQGQKYYAQSWITYDEWKNGVKNRYSLDDIAIIILEGEGIVNTNIRANIVYVDSIYLYKRTVQMSGWGRTNVGKKPVNLRRGSLTVISNEECSAEGSKLKGKKFTVPPNYFCTKADPYVVSTCGDAGAPIVLKRQDQLVGISIGVCPVLEDLQFNTHFLNENQMNSHLNFNYYRDFIFHNKL